VQIILVKKNPVWGAVSIKDGGRTPLISRRSIIVEIADGILVALAAPLPSEADFHRSEI